MYSARSQAASKRSLLNRLPREMTPMQERKPCSGNAFLETISSKSENLSHYTGVGSNHWRNPPGFVFFISSANLFMGRVRITNTEETKKMRSQKTTNILQYAILPEFVNGKPTYLPGVGCQRPKTPQTQETCVHVTIKMSKKLQD